MGGSSSQKPEIKIPDPFKDLWRQFSKQFNWFFTFIIGAMLIGFITMVIMVAQLVIDSARFNSTTNKENKQLEIQEKLIKQTVMQQEVLIEAIGDIKKDISELKEK